VILDEEAADNSPSPTPDGDEPSASEKRALRRVGESLPKAAYIVAVVELCERFTYYGCQGLFQNYISNKQGLHMGQKAATALNTFFTFFSYCKLIFPKSRNFTDDI
jgi:proton-dependent oligopeptide transporter, POT family